jgi:hypothetical protein
MPINTSGRIKKAFANVAAGTTDGDVVVAVTDKKIRVHAVVFQCGGTATTAVFNTKGTGAGTAISMTFQNGTNGGAVLPVADDGWFETAAGAGLTLTTGAGSTTGVQVIYSEA